MKKKRLPRIKKLLQIVSTLFLLYLPNVIFGQAPDLGAASSFALFTKAGAFTNTGATVVTGDIGTNVGSFTGFPPGVVIGQIHVADGVSAMAAPDVSSAYGYLSTLTCGLVIGTTMGNGQILTPNIYCAGAASTLNGNLTFDAQGDPNAIFIIKINGAFSTSTNTNIFLINSASLCNIYWQVNGQFNLGEGSTFRGTLIASGAINLLSGSSLYGRALSTAGAISLHTNIVTIGAQPTPSTIIANGPTTFCSGGSVTLSGNNNGGIWSTGETTSSIIVSTSGDYFVTNTNECSSILSNHIIVTVNPNPTVNITPSGPTTFCQGGSVTLTASNNLSYLWSTGATTKSITVTTSGNYNVTVTNSFGCTAKATAIVVIVNPLPVVNITAGGPTTFCQGGTVQLCASNGVSYIWNTNAITQCINATQTGTYSVTVTDANGCKASASINIVVLNLPICSITGNLTFCAGQSTQLCAPAGNAAYLWSTGATTSCITVNESGTYAVTITNSNACTSSCNAIVSENPIPNCIITGESFICNGQSIQLCAPTGNTSYKWNTGATTSCISVNNPGTYSVTVTNSSGCTSTCSKVITLSTQNCNISGNPVICSGQSTQLCVPEGNSAYIWNTGATTNCITVTQAGTYSVTVSNSGGCSSTCSIVVTSNISPNCSITGNLSICDGKYSELCATVGNYTYLWNTGEKTRCISVNVAGTYSVTLTSSNGCSSTCDAIVTSSPAPNCLITGDPFICNGQSTQLCTPTGYASYLWNTGATTNCINVINPGTYSTTVTNSTGCTSVCSKEVKLSTQFCQISGNPLLCGGQSTQLCVPEGSSSYKWNTGATTNCITVSTSGTYSVTITNSGGCSSTCSIIVSASISTSCLITGDFTTCEGRYTELCAPIGNASYLWSNGDTTRCINVNTAGTYAVTVTNSAGCTGSCSQIVTSQLVPNCEITWSGALCEGEFTSLCAPIGKYKYLWSTGDTSRCISVNIRGNYSVTVTNTSGCSSICSIKVTAFPMPDCNISCSTTLCDGLSKKLCVAYGYSSYLWSNGDTTNCTTIYTSGVYSVTVTNCNGCSSVCSVSVVYYEGPNCSITCSTNLCEGKTSKLYAPAGYLAYLWNTGATTSSITINTGGTYTVTITNADGCTGFCTTFIKVFPIPNAIITGQTIICKGDTAYLNAGSGYASYLWNNGDTTQILKATLPGTYYVVVTNLGGCFDLAAVIVVVNPIPQIYLGKDTTIIKPNKLILDPGFGFINYLWSDTSYNQTLIVSKSGIYSVTVTDIKGCEGSDAINVIFTPGTSTYVTPTSLPGSLVIFPNPTSGLVELSFRDFEDDIYSIGIYDLAGKLILKDKVEIHKKTQSVKVDLNNASKGMYLVKIESKKGTIVQQLETQ